MTKGKYKVVDNCTIEITELPIGAWTQDFKTLLDMYESGFRNAADLANDKKKGKTPAAEAKKPKWAQYADANGRLIKSYKNESSESQIKFTITFDAVILNKLLQGVDKAGLSELEKLFYLSTKLCCAKTMNLYDENNKLHNFKSIEDILTYYYAHRLKYYGKRRENLIRILEQEVLMLSTRARFIIDVINENIRIRNVPRGEVIAQLQKLDYPIIDDDKLVLLNEATPQQKESVNYDYLIKMPIYSLTKEKVDELLQEKDAKTQELVLLRRKSDKDLWEADLKVFETEYKKHIDEFYDYMDINPKEIETRMQKTATKRVVIRKRDSTTTTPTSSRMQTPVNVPDDVEDDS
jgi:DNA topoisomerase-2